MGEYIDYFEDWLKKEKKEKDERYKKLQAMFKKADEGFGERFGGDEANDQERRDKENNFFNHNLDELDKLEEEEEGEIYQSEDSLRKMFFLTKGNILLRKGQYLGEHFQDPQRYYQQACVVLQRGYDSEGSSFLDLMIQLSMGKYFRNMGKHNARSDYWRALDEFKELKEKIDKEQDFSYEKTHIWLEAWVNIGRIQRYLYYLREAKREFLSMISVLLAVSEEKISINDSLDAYIRDQKSDFEDLIKKLKREAKGICGDYLVRVLVELGIAYQKSQDYEKAQDICITILKRDANNVDAANSLGVCLRKRRIKASLGDKEDKEEKKPEDSNDYMSKTYSEIFEELGGKGNRFAKLQYIKCSIYEKNQNKDDIKKEIVKLLEENAGDQEVRLLYGIFCQRFGDLEESEKIFEGLYQESPQIAKGTIGLKAYYNIADNLLRQNKYYEARKYYEKILEACEKADDHKTAKEEEGYNAQKEKVLADFSRKDLLAEIALGWCLMGTGDYEEARRCYEEILKLYKDMPKLLLTGNEMRVRNNLAECYLHLVKGIDEGKDEERLRAAKEHFEKVKDKEPKNAVMYRHYGYYHILKSRRAKDWSGKVDEVAEALKCFEKAEMYNLEDVYIHAGWVAATVTPLLEEKDFEESGKRKLIQMIENKLRYSSGVYSVKACAKLAFFIKMQEDEHRRFLQNNEGEDKEEKLRAMYRSLARIRLSKGEEGYGMFRRFVESDEFCGLEAVKQGEILVGLFCLYDQIARIKDICRFVYKTEETDADLFIPVHYTKIDTLKKLLPDDKSESGKLRLWNTVYMNDSFEGESFIDMMKHVEKKRLKKDGTNDISGYAIEKMKRYFPYLEKEASEENLLVPINENIYVISFSKVKNEIYMWVPYADDAQGCAITFENDFLDIRKAEDTLTDVSKYSDEDYPLYEIQYLEPADLVKWERGEIAGESKIGKILDIMEQIWEILDDLESRMEGNGVLNLKWNQKGCGGETRLVRNFMAGCLNEVRFLIKNSEYEHEKEIRMLHYSYEPKIDAENFDVPRLYTEVEREIQIKEVKLGSKISDSQVNEIVSWLTKTGKVGCVTKSGRHYK